MKTIGTCIGLISCLIVSACDSGEESNDQETTENDQVEQRDEDAKKVFQDALAEANEDHDFKPENDAGEEPDSVFALIHRGHQIMNGYNENGYDDRPYNVENLKDRAESNIKEDIPEAYVNTDDDVLKKDLEDIFYITYELKENVENDEERDHLVRKLRDIYADLDYYFLGNETWGSMDVTHYAESQSENGQSDS
ncbi:hypothetical protein EPH95_05560 [Salicibibacter halophilus]|uniref:Uncharacterized protein n=1 Tax=Salicibibacter halophilus TaxID=2502791 RepID=A0A514LFV1_9BACI|nr:hypothetical protein [Salicibibacter halophilus]QDI90709.1 hypothetical protein EPH95_05560 [Salicibibacter halophilus]